MDAGFKDNVISGFIWRLIQKTSSQVIGLVISIVLARILSPYDYGVIAMVTVFTNIALVFINIGFSSSIVQKKDLSEKDISTMFYVGMILSFILYGILFFASPFIADMYKEPKLTDILRVESLIVILGASYSVQQALINRSLEFKKNFIIGICSTVAQGIVGITLALNGFGAWALVFSTLACYVVSAVMMWIMIKWKPKLIFSVASFKSMFGFSAKMLGSGLLDAVFKNIRSLIIGTQYSSQELAYYNKGYQYPTLIMTQVDGTITTVLFSSLSKYQSDWENGLRVLRRAMKLSIYICTPIMAGMCAVADPMIRILLTDKWEGSIIYVRLVCIICMFWPLSAQRHALNSLGKSGVSLKLNLIGKIVTVICLLSTYRHSVQLMIASSIIASTISLIISAFFYRKHLQYSFRDQIADVAPSIILSAVMGLMAYSVMFFNLNSVATLAIQVVVGVTVYFLGSVIFRFDSFYYMISLVKSFLNKRKNKGV